jgi:phosphoribosyl 1,2-cyclic phosphodiesterase
VISKKYSLPVHITPSTLKNSGLALKKELTAGLRAYEPVLAGTLSITAFPKRHDAADPHSFIVEHEHIKIGVLTDIGSACENVIKNFALCDAAFLEANYDEEMLEKGRYPGYLKKRISSDQGHLSNTQALALFCDHAPAHMSHLFLSHLSRDNNRPGLAEQLFKQHCGNIFVKVASRYKETAVHEIKGGFSAKKKSLPERDAAPAVQMTLF